MASILEIGPNGTKHFNVYVLSGTVEAKKLPTDRSIFRFEAAPENERFVSSFSRQNGQS